MSAPVYTAIKICPASILSRSYASLDTEPCCFCADNVMIQCILFIFFPVGSGRSPAGSAEAPPELPAAHLG